MNKAAFYDLDGTLLSCNLVTMHAYYARNDRSVIKSANHLRKVLLSVPLLFGLDLYSRSLFTIFSFRAYRGMHRDRLIGLADDLFEVTLKPSIFPQAQALINTTSDLGYRNVLVTERWISRSALSRCISALKRSFVTGSNSKTTLPQAES